MKGTYLNGWFELEVAERMSFSSKEEMHTLVSRNGGAVIFEEDGEHKVIRSDDERGLRSVLLGHEFGWIARRGAGRGDEPREIRGGEKCQCQF